LELLGSFLTISRFGFSIVTDWSRRGTLISSPHAKTNYDRWLNGKERDWGIRKGGRRECLGSCIYIKFEGREVEGKVVVVVYCLRVLRFSRSVLIVRETLNIGIEVRMQQRN
jgi:hypothetical protein